MKKKKKYYDLLAGKEEKTTYIGLANYGLVLLCLVLIIIMCKIATSPKPIYYIPSATRSGTAYPNHIPNEAVESFGLSYVLTRANFTPATIKSVLDATYKYLTPKLRATDKAKEKYLYEHVVRSSLAQTFSLTSEPSLKETSSGYEITIPGSEQKYTGKSLASTEKVIYRVLVKKVVATEINKYGLAIAGVEREVSK